MPAPDVQYFLDSSVECGHVAPDTHFYFMEIARDAKEVLDASDELTPDDERSHWSGLAQTGLYLEDIYLDWRANANRREAKMATFIALQGIPHILTAHAQNAAQTLAQAGHHSLTRDARRLLDKHFEFTNTMAVSRRALNRGGHDFSGWDVDGLRSMRIVFEGKIAANQLAERQIIERLHEGIRCGDVALYDAAYDELGNKVHRFSDEREIKKAQRALAERAKHQRRVVKRSIKFFDKLVGADATRMFVGGGALRIEGNLATYELKRNSSMSDAHGGFRALSVFDKDHPELHLCDICIYTDKVPLLDHIASLIMHIKAGEEEEILRIGNARNVSEAAYTKDWLTPFVGPATDFIPAEDIEAWGLGLIQPPWVAEGVEFGSGDYERCRKMVHRLLYDEIMSDHIPLLRDMKTVYSTMGPTRAAEIAATPDEIAMFCLQAIPKLPAYVEADEPWIDG